MIAKLSNHIAVNMRGRLEDRLEHKAAGKALEGKRPPDDEHGAEKDLARAGVEGPRREVGELGDQPLAGRCNLEEGEKLGTSGQWPYGPAAKMTLTIVRMTWQKGPC